MSNTEQWPGTSPATGSATGPGGMTPTVTTTLSAPAGSAAPEPPAPAPVPGRPEADLRYVAERLLATVREDLGRADSKAAILLSGAVALVAVLFSARRGGAAGAEGAEGAAHAGAAECAQTVLLLLGGLTWTAGLVLLVGVLVPRTRIAADRTFLRDLTSGTSSAVLLPKLTESSTDVVRWTLDQTCALGAVLARKYTWLRLGICCLALGAVFTLFSEMWR